MTFCRSNKNLADQHEHCNYQLRTRVVTLLLIAIFPFILIKQDVFACMFLNMFYLPFNYTGKRVFEAVAKCFFNSIQDDQQPRFSAYQKQFPADR